MVALEAVEKPHPSSRLGAIDLAAQEYAPFPPRPKLGTYALRPTKATTMPPTDSARPLYACPTKDPPGNALFLPPSMVPANALSHGDGWLLGSILAAKAIMATFIIAGQPGWVCGGKLKPTRALVNKVAGAVLVYAADSDYPSNLQALVDARLIKAKQLKDPWANPLRLQRWSFRPDVEFEVCSSGEDGLSFTPDDVCSD